MTEFHNIQETLRYSLGTLEGAENDLKVGDYLEVVDSSWFLGRLVTQLKLYFEGKGWVNENSAGALLHKMEPERLASIDKLCNTIIHIGDHPEQYAQQDEDAQHEVSEMLGIEPSEADRTERLKSKLEHLLGDNTDRSIQTLMREMKLLRTWIQSEEQIRFDSVKNALDTHLPRDLASIEENEQLAPIFHEFLEFVSESAAFMEKNPTMKLPESSTGETLIHLLKKSDTREALTNPQTQRLDLSRFQTENPVHAIIKRNLAPEFKNWLSEKLSKGQFDKDECNSLFDGLIATSQKTDPEKELNRLRTDILAHAPKPTLGKELGKQLEGVTREHFHTKSILNHLLNNKLIKPLLYKERFAERGFPHHPVYHLGGVEPTPLMKQAKAQLDLLVKKGNIELIEDTYGDFENYKLSELESQIRELGEEPVLFEAFKEFLPKYFEQGNYTETDLAMITTTFPNLEKFNP
jgi:hypothetical protein